MIKPKQAGKTLRMGRKAPLLPELSGEERRAKSRTLAIVLILGYTSIKCFTRSMKKSNTY